MRNSRQIKIFVFFFIFTFMALYSPRLLADNPESGNLTGFIYKADRTSPFEKAVIEVRNITTGSVYESTISDAFGAFRIDEVEKGLYIVSIRTEKGNFQSRNIIGVRENETAKIAFGLRLRGREGSENMTVGTADVIASSGPVIYDYGVVAGNPPGPPFDPPGPPFDPPGPPFDPPGPPFDPPGPPFDPPGPPFDPPEPDPSSHKPDKPKK